MMNLKSLKRRIYIFQSFSFYQEARMPPRRAPSVPSVASRAPSPVMEEDETPFFDSVDELQQHGINVQDILKLKSAAINTVSGVNMTTRRQLLKIKVDRAHICICQALVEFLMAHIGYVRSQSRKNQGSYTQNIGVVLRHWHPGTRTAEESTYYQHR